MAIFTHLFHFGGLGKRAHIYGKFEDKICLVGNAKVHPPIVGIKSQLFFQKEHFNDLREKSSLRAIFVLYYKRESLLFLDEKSLPQLCINV